MRPPGFFDRKPKSIPTDVVPVLDDDDEHHGLLSDGLCGIKSLPFSFINLPISSDHAQQTQNPSVSNLICTVMMCIHCILLVWV